MAIISHKYRYVFLHARKTAGSSIEVMLGKHCGPDDILYPTSDGRPLGIYEKNNRKPLNNCCFADIQKAIVHNKEKDRRFRLKQLIAQTRRIIPDKHATAYEIRDSIPKDVWGNYFKFCFERNPYDRLVSFYYWRIRNLKQPPSFEEFAFAAISSDIQHQKKYNARGFSNRPFYIVDNQEVCDRICKFEDLKEETRSVCDHLGIPWDGVLPRIKSAFRPKMPYANYYSKQLVQAMEKAFNYELNRFNYRFLV